MKRIRLPTLRDMCKQGEKIACLTAYDACFSRLLDAAGIDVLLVGDSLGMVLANHDTTLAVRLEDMIYHTRMVDAGRCRALLVADMPFMCYATPVQALGNAGRLVAEGGAELVKLEGGRELRDTVSLLSERGIAVCCHLGLTPQSVHRIGGYVPQGKDPESAQRLREDALILEQAGAMMLVLECVPARLAAEITQALAIPVIGIGAGGGCDGQVLVLHDMLGLTPPKRFSKVFLDVQTGSVQAAVAAYLAAVKSGAFPTAEHTVD